LPVVIDASFIAAELVVEEHSQFVRTELDRLGDTELSAPGLLYWEVANILWKKVRRGGLTEHEPEMLLALFHLMNIEVEAPRADYLTTATRLAVNYGLTVYDASYLELALRTGAVLASLDQPLVTVARRVGLKTCSPFT